MSVGGPDPAASEHGFTLAVFGVVHCSLRECLLSCDVSSPAVFAGCVQVDYKIKHLSL